MNKVKIRYLILLVLITLIIGVIATSCTPTVPLVVHNSTNQTLTIFMEFELYKDKYTQEKIGDVTPRGEVKNTFVGYSPPGEYTILAKDTNGNVVYQDMFTYDDLKWLNGKIVITAFKISK